jgi:choice-of-anchor B domain-containing protein
MKNLIKYFLMLCILGFNTALTAQLSPTVNMTFRSKMGFGMSGGNICGYASKGREYALYGNAQGMAIVDVTNPDVPVLIQQVSGLQSQWREIKVYRNYAYVTTEATPSGLQIVDLSSLPQPTTTTVYRGADSTLNNIYNIHALHIDTAKGFVYLFGGNSDIVTAGVPTITNGVAVVLDIKTDPLHPRFVGKSTDKYTRENYIHDGYVRGDTLYSGNIYAGLFSIIDFRDKKNPILLNTQQTPSSFNHNTWLSDDSKTLFTTDENAGSYLAAYDVSNPKSIKYLDKIRTVAGANAIVHNTHIINDFAVTSWYTEGVTIVDAHRPQNLVQVAQYDTYGGTQTAFSGCWGVYPYLPSGNLICSNITDTMYVLTPQYKRACYLEGTAFDSVTRNVLSGVLVKINTTDMDKKAQSDSQGQYKTGQVTGGTVSVTYSRTGYQTKTLTGIGLASGRITTQDVALAPLGVGVKSVTDDNALIVFPNPAKSRIFLSENSLKDEEPVEILDISGKLILRSTVGQGRGGFDIQNLANGDYFLKIGVSVMLKFSKML